jgi:hypothetical protein
LKKTILYTFYFYLFCLFSCNVSPDQKNKDANNTVAQVGNEMLEMDLFKENFNNTPVKDSIYLAKKLIEGWALEELLYREALDNLEYDKKDVERRVRNYQKSLINYLYEQRLIEINLDTSVTTTEIDLYYKEHKANFILKDNLVKVNFIKVPVKAPGLEKIQKLVRSGKDQEQLINLCIQNAENFYLNDSTWLFLDEIKKEIPALKEQSDLNFGQGKLIEFSDDSYYYYLKIKDVKVKNSLSPLNFEKENIKNLIINSRKTQLINAYKQQLLEKAKEDKVFQVY